MGKRKRRQLNEIKEILRQYYFTEPGKENAGLDAMTAIDMIESRMRKIGYNCFDGEADRSLGHDWLLALQDAM